ncbi:hypothetical protein [Xanthomonas sp. 1678]|uniref:hypothetical protein n=1 Tax=Xanthomonas sp. 1678 TaxID=3158788 RepID=UPI00285895D9|nr:hypothetical protein [Xanthomonas translucens]
MLAPNDVLIDASGVAWLSGVLGPIRVDPASKAVRSGIAARIATRAVAVDDPCSPGFVDAWPFVLA